MVSSDKIWAIIPAAGIGARMQNTIPKQYLPLGDKSSLQYVLDALTTHPDIEKIIVALHPDDAHWSSIMLPSEADVVCVHGGDSRAGSVMAALSVIASEAKATDWVLVHDASRPLLTHALIDLLLTQLRAHPVGGALGAYCVNALKRVDENQVLLQNVDRNQICEAQTPQLYRFSILLEAYQQAMQTTIDFVDESHVVTMLGYQSKIVLSSSPNLKITYPDDQLWVACYLNAMEGK